MQPLAERLALLVLLELLLRQRGLLLRSRLLVERLALLVPLLLVLDGLLLAAQLERLVVVVLLRVEPGPVLELWSP